MRYTSRCVCHFEGCSGTLFVLSSRELVKGSIPWVENFSLKSFIGEARGCTGGILCPCMGSLDHTEGQ